MPRSSPPLSGWFVVSLRPVGQHRPLLRVAERLGAGGVSLPGLRLTAREDTPTRNALDAALDCSRVIFTSPAAVRNATRLRPLHARKRQSVFALGSGTRSALRRAGIADVLVPLQASSESLLLLPGLAAIAGARIGIVTAAGGRDLLVRTLRERGAKPAVVHVYARTPARLNRLHAQRLLDASGRGAACITSAEALHNVLAALPAAARAALLRCVAITSSARLEACARDAGFATVLRAASPAPRDLIEALCMHANRRRFR